MPIPIENFLLNKKIMLFLVCELITCIYFCKFPLYFRNTINGEHYQIVNLTFSGDICEQHQENVYFIVHSTMNSTAYKIFSEN